MNIKFKNKRTISKLWKDRLKEYSQHSIFFETKRVGETLEDSPELAQWVADQRILFQTGQLTKAEFKKLESANFEFQIKNYSESELMYEYGAILKKSNLDILKTSNNWLHVSQWKEKTEKSLKSDINFYDSSPENNKALDLMVKSHLITKNDIKKRKASYKWYQVYDLVKKIMIDDNERLVSSKHLSEYRWVEYYIKKDDALSKDQKSKFKIIHDKFKLTIQEEKENQIKKMEVKKEALRKDPTATSFEYKNCDLCGNIKYSLKGECVKCSASRDKLSKNKRKEKDLLSFNAKVAAQTAKRKALKHNATPKWLNKENHKQIEDIYLESQNKTKTEGVEHHVDHIIPLVGKDYVKMEDGTLKYIHVVCGLHTPENMQVMIGIDNKSKQARFDMNNHDEDAYLNNFFEKQVKTKQSIKTS
jgi:hypothetical protein